MLWYITKTISILIDLYPILLTDDVSSKDPMNPKDFVFRVNVKAAGNAKANEPIRLVNGNSPSEGRVEIFYNGR